MDRAKVILGAIRSVAVIAAGFGVWSGMQSSPEPEAAATLPEYRVLDTVDQLSGATYGDVLVPSVSRDTSVARREEIARGIASEEGFGELALYCSEAAMQAQYSSSFAEENPDAQACYLGSFRDDAFSPPVSR